MTLPVQFDHATVEASNRLRRIETASEAVVDRTVPHNTRRAFTADWATWTAFCAAEGIPPGTVSSGLLVAFATWCAHPTPDRPAFAPATITRRLAGVLDGWKRAHLSIPHGITKDARRVVRAYAKHLNEQGAYAGRGSSPALTIRALRDITAACPDDTITGLRDRSLIVLGFSIAARRSELAALNVDDVVEQYAGLLVRVRDGKTGGRTVAVPHGTEPNTCPVRTWNAWLAAAGIDDGRAYRSISQRGKMGASISGDAINDIVQQARLRAGVSQRLTAHSMRSGLATEARRAGHDAKTIAVQGGWKPNSAVLYGYMQIVDRWSDNAVKGIGL